MGEPVGVTVESDETLPECLRLLPVLAHLPMVPGGQFSA